TVKLLVVAKGGLAGDVAGNALEEQMCLLVEVYLLGALLADKLHADRGTSTDLDLLVQQGHLVVGVLQPQYLPGAEEFHVVEPELDPGFDAAQDELLRGLVRLLVPPPPALVGEEDDDALARP